MSQRNYKRNLKRDKWKEKVNITKFMGCSEGSAQREIYSCKYVHRKRRSKICYLTLHLKEVEKEEQAKPQAGRRKKIIKIRVEIYK